MTTVFISDLHLDPAAPAVSQQFIALLAQLDGKTEALFILGDFVEYWLGDDDTEHGLDAAFQALKQFTATGVPTFFMHGNRDFLLGDEFAAEYGLTLLNDPTVIDLYGEKTLLLHGDTLCTDDIEYQKFRAQVRNPLWQQQLLAQPLAVRRQLALELRASSQQAMHEKAAAIMDVNQEHVLATLREHGVRQIIHGHTHRPKIHEFILDGAPAKRIVLGDWHPDRSSALYVTAEQMDLQI